MPLQFGLLTGKFPKGHQFKEDDHRSFRLTPEILSRSQLVIDEMVMPVAKEEGMTLTELALGFILSYEEISTVIPGIRTPQHVGDNTKGIRPISPESRQQLEELAQHQGAALMALMEAQG
jgi:aryl-alcohol dehydrogenase-like predicted oxidoreductase